MHAKLNIDTPYTLVVNADGSQAIHTPWQVIDLPAEKQQPLQSAENSAELDDLTRAELYAIAQERDIPGRGRMSKAQLIAALQEAT